LRWKLDWRPESRSDLCLQLDFTFESLTITKIATVSRYQTA